MLLIITYYDLLRAHRRHIRGRGVRITPQLLSVQATVTSVTMHIYRVNV